MKYKIMRLNISPNHIFIDLYNPIFIDRDNQYFALNIELKFCCYNRSADYKTLINWLKYNQSMNSDVEPQKIIEDYEKITFGKKIEEISGGEIDKNNKK